MIELFIFILLLLSGYFANRKFDLSQGKYLMKHLLIYVGIPCIALSSVLSHKSVEFGLISAIVAFSLVMNIFFSEAGNRILNLKYKGSFILMNSFSNAGFLGLPICWILFGDIGLYYGALYILTEILIHYSLGIFASVYSDSGKFRLSAKKVGRFPAFWILGAVYLFIISGIGVPKPFMDLLGILSKVGLGLAIFYIGSNLVKPKNIPEFFSECSYVAVFRFFISPLIILFPLLYFGVEYYYILVLEAMMPPAIGNTIVAGYYKLNEKLCANITTVLIIVFLFGFFILSGFFAIFWVI